MISRYSFFQSHFQCFFQLCRYVLRRMMKFIQKDLLVFKQKSQCKNNSKHKKQTTQQQKMMEKPFQTFRLEGQPPTQISVNSVNNIAEVNCQMKSEQHMDIEQGKLCNEESMGEAVSGISKKQWSVEEDELVYRLHNQYGNKWAIIAEQLRGRTDNCIKNHFYSRLRKGLRKINKIIEDSSSRQFKEFKIIDLYKVIQASDQKFKEINSYPNEMTDFGHDLKNRLFIFAEEESDGTHQYDVKTKKLLDDMNEFTKKYKRKSKKSRRYSPMGVGSVYRNNKKLPNAQNTQACSGQMENTGIQTEVIVKIQVNEGKNDQEEDQKRQKKAKGKKQIPLTFEQSKLSQTLIPTSITIPAPVKRQKQAARQITLPELLQVIQQPPIARAKKNTYRKFSDDEGQEKDQAQYARQQRLNHFAENILKTFKSYYSFKSFKSNSMMDDFIFQ